MRFLIVFVIIIMFSCACKEKTSYRLQLLIENNLNDSVIIKLYPKKEYMYGDLYDNTENGGGYSDTIFVIRPNDDYNLYYSKNLNQNPSDLACKIFDSIQIRILKINRIIFFTKDTVIGYNENLFDKDSNWKYKIQEFDEPDNFNRNPVESHNYSFQILTEKIIK